MGLRLYDTKTRSIRPFTPLVEGQAGVYVCGATVQGAPHLGHLRSAVAFDQLRRWLTFRGFRVTFVRNVTDIDDKILVKSIEEGRPWWEHAFRYEQDFTAAYDALGIARPSYEPRATGHITEMIELIERLIAAGHAYPALDDSGDVYFDSASWPDYGELTRQRLGDMEPATDATPRGKRDPRDFALWKGHKQGEPETASWPTPWGRGRPGWHLECSAMATKYLGPAFDIHGGGLDLRFPHHENELAQSRAAGDDFAATWMHAGMLNIGGEKMSKSLGNSIFPAELLAQAGPLALRYALGTAHYRSTLDFTPGETLERALPTVARLRRFLAAAREALGNDAPELFTLTNGYAGAPELPAAFIAALDDDLAVPQALAVVFDTVAAGNGLLGSPGRELAAAAAQVQTMLNVLGIDPLDADGPDGGDSGDPATEDALAALVAALVERRAQARAAKDYAAADQVRDLIASAGIELIDTPNDTRFRIKEN